MRKNLTRFAFATVWLYVCVKIFFSVIIRNFLADFYISYCANIHAVVYNLPPCIGTFFASVICVSRCVISRTAVERHFVVQVKKILRCIIDHIFIFSQNTDILNNPLTPSYIFHRKKSKPCRASFYSVKRVI